MKKEPNAKPDKKSKRKRSKHSKSRRASRSGEIQVITYERSYHDTDKKSEPIVVKKKHKIRKLSERKWNKWCMR